MFSFFKKVDSNLWKKFEESLKTIDDLFFHLSQKLSFEDSFNVSSDQDSHVYKKRYESLRIIWDIQENSKSVFTMLDQASHILKNIDFNA